jgi:glycosyltransferase involved in cell wall biosynthesis
MKVISVIPSWNCSATLAEVVKEVKDKVDSIVLVDDGSTDQTREIAKLLTVDYLRHPINRGQGAALKTGTIYALSQDADVIVHFDADGQFRAEDIPALVNPIIKGEAEIVFGSRFLDDTTKMPAFKKKVIMPLAHFINRVFFNIKMSDPQSGFRAFSRRAAKQLDWQQDRMAHCSEILVAAHASKLPIVEVPITVLYPDFGQKLGGGFKILYDMFIAKLNS